MRGLGVLANVRFPRSICSPTEKLFFFPPVGTYTDQKSDLVMPTKIFGRVFGFIHADQEIFVSQPKVKFFFSICVYPSVAWGRIVSRSWRSGERQEFRVSLCSLGPHSFVYPSVAWGHSFAFCLPSVAWGRIVSSKYLFPNQEIVFFPASGRPPLPKVRFVFAGQTYLVGRLAGSTHADQKVFVSQPKVKFFLFH